MINVPDYPDVLPMANDYSGFPADVAADRLMDAKASNCEFGNPDCPICNSKEKKMADNAVPLEKPFTEAELLRLAGQLERAELQGWRFERYARCRVSSHRHRWEITSKLCQIWTYLKG